MYELINDKFYKEYSNYIDSSIDYCIIKSNECGIEGHKKALMFLINKLEYTYNEDKMIFTKISLDDLFNGSYKKMFLELPTGIPYRKMYGDKIVNENYSLKDFDYLNSLLFPNGIDNLEIYSWNFDWSDYFDEGLEWWGALCISVYDKSCDRYVVIASSVTD